VIADQTGADWKVDPGQTPTFDGHGAKGRYIRVTATKLWPRADGVGCFALAELGVESGGKNLALGAPVAARTRLNIRLDRRPG